ncbi:hypothetical protein LMG27177_07343 [Paraburkholderia fynbosensis]|uniref:Uncharacterized protein n=1 Tax=Paraburkholderia fynbosensis TaxID=1200993 RepID=A0A6J5H2U2_9BURK|nr:hypothetical protein LMG27177_07343 [Paraburkholderia fynbosensis]
MSVAARKKYPARGRWVVWTANMNASSNVDVRAGDPQHSAIAQERYGQPSPRGRQSPQTASGADDNFALEATWPGDPKHPAAGKTKARCSLQNRGGMRLMQSHSFVRSCSFPGSSNESERGPGARCPVPGARCPVPGIKFVRFRRRSRVPSPEHSWTRRSLGRELLRRCRPPLQFDPSARLPPSDP